MNRLTMGLGAEVPPSAIHWHLQELRKRASKMGIIAPKRTSQARAKGPAKAKGQNTSSKGKKEMDDTDENDEDVDGGSVSSMDEDSDEDGIKKIKPHLSLNKQKTIGGRVTKQRTSPRKNKILNYKAIFDQFSAEDNTSEEEESNIDTKMTSDVEEGIKVKAEI